MRSITQLIQEINKDDPERKREYDAFKQLDDNIIELNNSILALEKKNMRYYCRAYRAASFTIPNLAVTAIPLDRTEYPQFGNMHSDTVENTKIWIRRSGVYHISGGLTWSSSSAGTYRYLHIRLVSSKTGTVHLCSNGAPPMAVGAPNALNVACSYYLYEGDYIELTANQDSGAGGASVLILYPESPFLAVAERMEDLDPSQYGLLDPSANMR